MKTEQAKQLLTRYLAGNASAKEIHMVESFIEEELLANSWNISEEQKKIFGLKLKEGIDQQVLGNGKATKGLKVQSKFRKIWMVSAAAAAVIAVVTLACFYVVKIKNESWSNRFANDVAPGGNNAVLTLSDGRKINLTDSKTGELASLNGISIKKAANGLLVLSVVNDASNVNQDQLNTIETPTGGQYQVNLPDGSQVWLNAGSKLKFPTRFAGLHRTVELNGEAYFEVAKDKSHPFVVQNDKQDVEVLGTHFNINGYDNEPVIKTTLLEGSVRVSNKSGEKIITPGEQSVVYGNYLEVKEIDPALAIDWKNGEFRFKDESLTSILRKLSRWYGVKFEMENSYEKMPSFSGSVSRFDQISVVLKMLEETGNIKFYINGKVVTVK